MNNSEFITKYTSGKCLSFVEFQVIAQKYGIYFEKINNDIVVCYKGEGDPRVDAFNFYKNFFPETNLNPSNFDLINHIRDFHFKFLKEKINQIAQNYSLPPVYNQSISLKDNAISLLNTLKLRHAIYQKDIDIIKYILNL
ncbi:MAG: hypothetical protein Q4A58_05130 [Fusobacterium sp.]|uniref:hypothetical protein n=1 Tax=Fusobacterium sp. TaxID=68766 RepID=UPI0026DD51A9|nr:hypothetical protein [Fusobacterium sp.]MDO4690661.1 hypothetical protein [Fusobacterium sp.]